MTTPSTSVHYRIEAADLHAHLYGVTLTIDRPQPTQRVSLPVWIAGSYMVREFSKQVLDIRAEQHGRAVQVVQLDKCNWQIESAADSPLVLHYRVHAHDDSVRTAWLDASRGFFNGTSLCLQVEGYRHNAHVLEVVAPDSSPRWRVATGLTAARVDARGFGTYLANDYDELVDCPVEMGNFWTGHFKACGIEHQFVVAGAPPSFDGARLLRDTQQICETALRFWHGKAVRKAPHARYLFMLNAVSDGYGGLEHRNSTALICRRSDLPRLGNATSSEGYTTLLGLISHEYFHTWNIKQLRPVEFTQYDYARENHTQLLWFFEGFTSYYDDLLLRRADLIDDTQYLRLLNKTINQVLQTPGRLVHSVAQSSFEAWTKYYRQDANSPNLTVSYYTKGALIALCLDLSLRHLGVRNHTLQLDQVMRALWQRCCTGSANGTMQETDVLTVLQELSGRSWRREIQAWVHGTRDLPLQALLEAHGVTVQQETAPIAQRLGLRVSEDHSVQIKQVLHGGLAHQAGIAAGDEWLGIEVSGKTASAWRLKKLDDLPLYTGQVRKVTALISRDQRLLRLTLNLPTTKSGTNWRLSVGDAAKVRAWLSGQAESTVTKGH